MIQKSDSGYSIIELVIVGALVAILSSFAIPQIRQSLDDYRLVSSSRIVASELNVGRALAISRNWTFAADFDTTDRTVQIIDPDTSSNNPRIPQTMEGGITFSSTPSPDIQFLSRGQSSGGAVVLTNAGGSTVIVTVTASGKVEIGDFVP